MNLQRWWDDFCYELHAEIKRQIELFSRLTTWLVIAALLAFAIELYFGMMIALRYDRLMLLLGVRIPRCRILTNWQYLTLVYILFASGVSMMYCMGSLVSWLKARDHRRQYEKEVRRLGWITLALVLLTEGIGALAIALLLYWC
ncbi:MAG: hypothetical protein LBG69_09230 [Zoogloeaceae bacterium]|jgi:predicted Na+-dependent transporter|nr:hypothetical protein [Zoogloeaceae bacterium]